MRVGLVLGAGGEPGGAWIRGALDGLERRTGFRPAMASTVVGTSIGAHIAARLVFDESVSPATASALLSLASAPEAPSVADRVLGGVRRFAGTLVCIVQPAAPPPPPVDGDRPRPAHDATVVSARCRPPQRRFMRLGAAERPDLEVVASGAVPFIRRPVRLDGAAHVDGAVLSAASADGVEPDEIDLLIVIAPQASTGRSGTMLSRLSYRQLRLELRGHAAAGVPAIVLVPSGPDYLRRRERGHRRVAERLVATLG